MSGNRYQPQFLLSLFQADDEYDHFRLFLEYRLSQTLNSLKKYDKAISEVALQSGFSTISYFISVFRKKMEVTPLEYKKNKIFLTIDP